MMKKYYMLALSLLILSSTLTAASLCAADGLKNTVHISISDGYRVITANGIPDHETGQFPNRGNPNRISEQTHRYRIPLKPVAAKTPIQNTLGVFGIALNGVTFDPGAAEFWNNDRSSGWQYEALGGAVNLGIDAHNAHVQPNGAYHYHALPTGLLQRLEKEQQDTMILLGWAADGYPIYAPLGHADAEDAASRLIPLRSSYVLKKGKRPSGKNGPGGSYDGSFVQDWEYKHGSGSLDQCNGRYGVTPEFPDGTYYYVISKGYPFIPRSWYGQPERGFLKQQRPSAGTDNKRPPHHHPHPHPPHPTHRHD